MEMNRKSISLAGLFTGYAAIFCVNTVLIVFLLLAAAFLALESGWFLPANYAEMYLNSNADEIRKTETVNEWMLPAGSSFGVYEADGTYLYGNFEEKAAGLAWQAYAENNNTAGGGYYYRFIGRDGSQVCIVKYILKMRFASEKLNERLPDAESLVVVVGLVLFFMLLIGNGILVSGKFSRVLKKRLGKLQDVTKKISENNLDFSPEYSDIREINEVLESLSRMKEVLQESLQKQWYMENQKKEQMAALTHDIKTPLTIIKGNAELLAEESLSDGERECTEYIIQNAEQIEQYLQTMRHILHTSSGLKNRERLKSLEFIDELKKAAAQIAGARKIPVSFVIKELEGTVSCNKELLLRSWGNIISNALEYTDSRQGIQVVIQEQKLEQQNFWAACVRDYGPGFSQKDLLYAKQKFYSGDESRHDRTHQGLGLAIAQEFADSQGGFLKLGNAEDGMGAVVTILLKSSRLFKRKRQETAWKKDE